MNRTEKHALKDDLLVKLNKASAVILSEYRGLGVESLSALRNVLRKNDAELKVAKNRVLKKALEEMGGPFSPILNELRGPTATVFVYGDAAQVAKALLNFKKENDVFEVKKGMVEGELLGDAALKRLSDLPSKEELLAKIVGSLVAPQRGLVCTINGVTRNLVCVLAAIRDKKSA